MRIILTLNSNIHASGMDYWGKLLGRMTFDEAHSCMLEGSRRISRSGAQKTRILELRVLVV